MIRTENYISRPDRSSRRIAYPYDAFVFTSAETLGYLCNISLYDEFMDAEASIEAYRKGEPILAELFEGIDVIAPVTTPIIKYGHMNSVGVPLIFPKTGQVALDMKQTDLSEVLKILKKPCDFLGDLTPFHVEYLKKMRQAFPGRRVHWGWQSEGPVTTIWGLAGNDAMYGVYDEPELFRECMDAVIDSLVGYTKFYCQIDGTAVMDPFPDHGRICDDIAAMFSPALWGEFVLPYWKRFMDEAPVPSRKIHCEDMKKSHLGLLDSLNLEDYDPGISPFLNPQMIADSTDTPFCWRLGSFLYPQMSEEMCHDFAIQAAVDGAQYTFTAIEPMMCTPEIIRKIRAYYDGAMEVRKALIEGSSRSDLKKLLHGCYHDAYWDNWAGFRK